MSAYDDEVAKLRALLADADREVRSAVGKLEAARDAVNRLARTVPVEPEPAPAPEPAPSPPVPTRVPYWFRTKPEAEKPVACKQCGSTVEITSATGRMCARCRAPR